MNYSTLRVGAMLASVVLKPLQRVPVAVFFTSKYLFCLGLIPAAFHYVYQSWLEQPQTQCHCVDD